MAALNIVKILQGRLREKIEDLYYKQNQENEQYLIYDQKHLELLVENAIDSLLKEHKVFAKVLHSISPSDISAEVGKAVSKNMTKSKIQKVYKKHGFKFIKAKAAKKADVNTKSIYFDPKFTGNRLKLCFPTPQSRAPLGKGLSKSQRSKPLPSIYDKQTNKGPNNDLLIKMITDTLKGIADSSGVKGLKGVKPSNVPNAVKLHGGEGPGGLFDTTEGAEGTTARTVDAIKQLKSGDLKSKVDKFAGRTLGQSSFDEGLETVLGEFDAHFTINNTTVSDIVLNQKKVKVGLTIGDKSKQELLEQGDKPGLKELYDNLTNLIIEYVKDPDVKTSKSMKKLNTERGMQAIVKNIAHPLTKKGTLDMRFKANKALMNKKGTKKQTTAEFKESFAKLTQAAIISKQKAPSKKAKKTGRYDPKTEASETSLAALMQIVNRSLPRHIKNNMAPPALQYRGQGNPSRPFAGPFNTGARVTSLSPYKKVQGGVQVNYTYEKYPYQTFEPGFKQGSVFRDPRRLIQESIRDIMIERKQTRFLNFRRY